MFFVAYTKDGEDPKTRPVSFLYNGGPGSASVWLHMGSFAPRKAQMADEGFQPPPPYQLVDNENSLIDVSDLVFVDAIGTGFSRVTEGVNAAQFHGQDGDIRAFGEFIAEYLKTYSRWPSPKFLIGESYGTIRSAGPVGGTAVAPRHRAERHRAGVRPDDLPDAVAGAEQRCRVRGADRDVRRDGLVPQEAARRPAAEDHQAGGGRGADVRLRRIPAGALEGQHAGRCGPRGDGGQAGASHRTLGEVHPRVEPARRLGPLPQGAAARQAADGRPARRPVHGARRSTPPANARSSTRRTRRCRAPTSRCSRTTSATC